MMGVAFGQLPLGDYQMCVEFCEMRLESSKCVWRFAGYVWKVARRVWRFTGCARRVTKRVWNFTRCVWWVPNAFGVLPDA
jgi:hypothetical protein